MRLLPLLLLASCASGGSLRAPIHCSNCDAWNQARPPSRVFGNTYQVGVQGLTSVLITSAAGHVLLDAGLPQSAARIEESIRALGFRVEDVKVIGVSHVHSDHVGGVAALQADSAARVVSSENGAASLRAGAPDVADPQSHTEHFPKVRSAQVVHDGEVVHVGPLAITAHASPGHTPGGLSWSWRSCEGERCRDIVYADSVTPVSDDGYRYGDHPHVVAAFRRTLAMLAALPCDVLLTTHPGAAGSDKGCRGLAEAASKRLDERLASEH